MTISSLLSGTSSSLLGSSSGSSTASQASTSSITSTAASTVSPFLAQAEQRIQSDAAVTTAQISKFGMLKSALTSGQLAAKAMTTLTSATKPADVTTALGNFFNTFNASVSAANSAATATGSSSQSARATLLVRDLKTALSADPASSAALKKLGLTIQTNGSLVQDAKKFAASLASDPSGTLAAMAKIGSKVDSVSSKELATGGTVGAALATLNAKNTSLTAQQTALQALNQAMAASAATSSTSTQSSTGVAAYQSTMNGF